MDCIGCTPLIGVREAAAALGVSRREIPRLVDLGLLVRLNRWVLVGKCVVERAAEQPKLGHALKLEVVQRRYPDAAASHESAALQLSLPVLVVPRFAIVTRASGAWRGGDNARVRIAPLPSHHVILVGGQRVTSAERTVVDVARNGSLAAAAVVGDAVMRSGVSRQDLMAIVDECSAWSDVGRCRRAIEFLDPLAESAFESMSRAKLHEGGVPAPESQVWLQGASGRWYRVDFYWRHRRLIGEADGRQKYVDNPERPVEEVVYEEKLREDDLRDAGENFVRWNYGQMAFRTEETIARIMRKLQG
jgi:hypothetical protein